jgi:hypothetical protein
MRARQPEQPERGRRHDDGEDHDGDDGAPAHPRHLEAFGSGPPGRLGHGFDRSNGIRGRRGCAARTRRGIG